MAASGIVCSFYRFIRFRPFASIIAQAMSEAYDSLLRVRGNRPTGKTVRGVRLFLPGGVASRVIIFPLPHTGQTLKSIPATPSNSARQVALASAFRAQRPLLLPAARKTTKTGG